MAKALMRSGVDAPLITIEKCSALAHDMLLTNDNISDLREILDEYGLSQKVQVIDGMRGDQHVTDAIRKKLGGQKMDGASWQNKITASCRSRSMREMAAASASEWYVHGLDVAFVARTLLCHEK